MKLIHLLVLLATMASPTLYARENSLFIITENNKIGYINSRGQVVIPLVFYNGSDFSEGLAAVRRNGYFGFIDTTGQEVIPSVYDYADKFNQGIARVFKNGIPVFINKNNEQVLSNAFSGLSFVNEHVAIVATKTEKQGVMNMNTRRLLVDTLFERIEGVYGDIAVVGIKGKSASDRWDKSYAIVTPRVTLWFLLNDTPASGRLITVMPW